MATAPRTRSNGLGRLGGAFAWLLISVVLAIAGSGLVLALDHPQNDSGRPELTARGDAIVAPRLNAMAPVLGELALAGNAVATAARQAYGHVRNRDTQAARADLPAGDAASASVAGLIASIRASRAALLDGTSFTAIGDRNRQWVVAIDAALEAAQNVQPTWQQIASAAVFPITVVEALQDHDATVLAATGLARKSDFKGAAATLLKAADDLDRARSLATQIAEKALDTSTLLGWITRAGDYDHALNALYTILVATKGVMTADAQLALDLVKRAEKGLPANDSALTLIVSDSGGQTMTIGLIALEQLRGTLAAAVSRPGSADASPGD